MLKKLLVVLFICFAIPQCFAANHEDIIPASTDFILRVNFQELLKMPEIKAKLEEVEKLSGAGQYSEQIKSIGFDPTKDLQTITVFVPSTLVTPEAGENVPVGMVVEGSINIDSTLEVINKKNKELPAEQQITVSKENGLTVLSHAGDKNGPVKAILLDNKRAVFGTPAGIDAVKSVIAGKGTTLAIKKDFVATMSKLSSNAQIVGVYAFSDAIKQQIAASGQANDFAKIAFLRFAVTKAKDLEIQLTGDFDASANIENCKAMLTSLVGILKQNPAPNEAIGDLAKNMVISTNGNSLIIDTKISNDALMKVITSAAENPMFKQRGVGFGNED